MTREEAIKIIDCYDIGFYDLSGAKIPADKLADAFDMAIEALQTKTIRCEECKHQDECEEVVLFEVNDEEVMGHRLHWCSYAERKEL